MTKIPRTIQTELSYYRPALLLGRLVSRTRARKIRRPITFLLALLLVFQIVLLYLTSTNADFVATLRNTSEGVALLISNIHIVDAITLFLVSIWLFFFLVWTFHNHYYFRGMDKTLNEGEDLGHVMSYNVAEILLGHQNEDLTNQFLYSSLGQITLVRCGIFQDELASFLASKDTVVAVDSLSAVLSQEDLNYYALAMHIFKVDSAFSNFLFKNGIQEKDYEGAVGWLSRTHERTRVQERWWSRDRLGRLPSIGAEWGYGRAWSLERFSKSIVGRSVFSEINQNSGYAEAKLREVEHILLKTKEANAILIGEEGVGKMDIVVALQYEIRHKTALPPLSTMQLISLDTNSLVAVTGGKQEFEQLFLKMLHEAEKAGNIIMVIENFPAFYQSVQALGSNPSELLNPFLTSPSLKIIATASPRAFHQIMESQSSLMQRFDQVYFEGSDLVGTIKVLEEVAEVEEGKGQFVITYPAIKAIAEGADRYISGGVMPDKALDLMLTIIPQIAERDTHVITKNMVMSVIHEKTGIPVGDITSEERDTLTNLEKTLHERIIGQDEAVNSLAKALRRSRTGIRNPDRPMGSFLFLGPTGVGKTETTKALAASYFGSDANIVRFDMSEYSGADALDRLIGSFETGQSGVLVNNLKEHPYGVLLLDEFEKADRRVHDLFLQILDEGVFADMYGSKINARNLMIIATSNAGSDLIWNAMQEGRELEGAKQYIVNEIIDRGDYRPEFLNRFDGIILFHPLFKDDLTKIAKILLKNLKERIRERGYDLVVNDVLVNLLVEKGYDPQFGARPMRRVMQEIIEQAIAQKIIDGAMQPGDSIELAESDLI